MISRRRSIFAAATAAFTLVLAFSVPATARLASNRLASNRLASNALSDKATFDAQAVTITHVVLPDGTAFAVR